MSSTSDGEVRSEIYAREANCTPTLPREGGSHLRGGSRVYAKPRDSAGGEVSTALDRRRPVTGRVWTLRCRQDVEKTKVL